MRKVYTHISFSIGWFLGIPCQFSRVYILLSYFICHQPELLICISYWPVEAGIAKKHYKQQFPWWNHVSYIPGGPVTNQLIFRLKDSYYSPASKARPVYHPKEKLNATSPTGEQHCLHQISATFSHGHEITSTKASRSILTSNKQFPRFGI